jgi:hypothetical protein
MNVVAVFDFAVQLVGVCCFPVYVYLAKSLQRTVSVEDQFSESRVSGNQLLDTFSDSVTGSLHNVVVAGKIRHVRMKMYLDGL